MNQGKRLIRNLLSSRYFSSNQHKPSIKPVIPTMAESFGEKLDKKIGDKYLNPIGFLNENGNPNAPFEANNRIRGL